METDYKWTRQSDTEGGEALPIVWRGLYIQLSLDGSPDS